MLGKLTPDELNECVLSVIKKRRSEILRGSAAGCDSAVIKTDDLMLLTTDPITGGGDDCGKLAVHVCCNDIAASGGEPLAILITVLAPERCNLSDIKRVMSDIEEEAEKLNIEVIGGHSEFTDAVNRMIISATAVGIRKKRFSFVPLKAGESIIVTKTLGLEGTLVIAKAFGDKAELSPSEFSQAMKTEDCLSVVAESVAAVESGAEIAEMHDITEGGVIGALGEILHGRGFGAKIDLSKAPLLEVTDKICRKLDINPMRLLSSGSLIIISPEPEKITKALSKNGIRTSVIGVVTDKEGVFDVSDENTPLEVRPDEICKLFKEQ